MKLNTDDTKVEQYINGMHKESDVMLNCENCSRLYFEDYDLAKRKFDKKIPLLCMRCRKEQTK